MKALPHCSQMKERASRCRVSLCTRRASARLVRYSHSSQRYGFRPVVTGKGIALGQGDGALHPVGIAILVTEHQSPGTPLYIPSCQQAPQDPPFPRHHMAPGVCTTPPSLPRRGTVPKPPAHENVLPPNCWGSAPTSSWATGSKGSTELGSLQPQHPPRCPTACPQRAALTRVLCHVVLELVHPLALVAAVGAEVLPLLLVDPHVVLGTGQEGRVSMRPCPLPWEHAGRWDASEGLTDSSDISNRVGQGGLSACLADYGQGGSTAGSG